MKRLRWILADWLSHLACWLRGHEWYEADVWVGASGNRVYELREQIFEACLLQSTPTDPEFLNEVGRALDELAQLAGENWGQK